MAKRYETLVELYKANGDVCKKVEEVLNELHNPLTGFNAMTIRLGSQYGGREKLEQDIKKLKQEKPENAIMPRFNAIACKKILEYEETHPGDFELEEDEKNKLEQEIYNEFMTVFNSALQSEDKRFHDSDEMKKDLDALDERKNQLSLCPYIFSKYHYYASCLNATTAFYYLAQKKGLDVKFVESTRWENLHNGIKGHVIACVKMADGNYYAIEPQHPLKQTDSDKKPFIAEFIMDTDLTKGGTIYHLLKGHEAVPYFMKTEPITYQEIMYDEYGKPYTHWERIDKFETVENWDQAKEFLSNPGVIAALGVDKIKEYLTQKPNEEEARFNRTPIGFYGKEKINELVAYLEKDKEVFDKLRMVYRSVKDVWKNAKPDINMSPQQYSEYYNKLHGNDLKSHEEKMQIFQKWKFSLRAKDIIEQHVPRRVMGCTGCARLFAYFAEQYGLGDKISVVANVLNADIGKDKMGGHQIIAVQLSDKKVLFDSSRWNKNLRFVKGDVKLHEKLDCYDVGEKEYTTTAIMTIDEYDKIKSHDDLMYVYKNGKVPKKDNKKLTRIFKNAAKKLSKEWKYEWTYLFQKQRKLEKK